MGSSGFRNSSTLSPKPTFFTVPVDLRLYFRTTGRIRISYPTPLAAGVGSPPQILRVGSSGSRGQGSRSQIESPAAGLTVSDRILDSQIWVLLFLGTIIECVEYGMGGIGTRYSRNPRFPVLESTVFQVQEVSTGYLLELFDSTF